MIEIRPDELTVLLTIAMGLLATAVLLYLTHRWPTRFLGISFFLVLVADTKFRVRDPLASLAGTVDAQVIIELGLYTVVGLSALCALFSRSFKYRHPNPLEGAVFAYVLLAVASTMWSLAPAVTFVRSLQLATLFLLATVTLRTMEGSVLVTALWAALVAYVVSFAAMALVFPWAAGAFSEDFGGQRFAWFSSHPVTVAAYSGLAALAVMAEGFYRQGGWTRRRFGIPLWAYVLPLVAILMQTRTRGPLLAFLFTVLMLTLLRRARLWKLAWLGCLLIGSSAVVVNYYKPLLALVGGISNSEKWLAAVFFRGQTVDELLSLTGRTDFWRYAWDLFLDSPVLGHGYQGARALLLSIEPWAGHSHNALLQTLLDLGLVGAALLWISILISLLLGFVSWTRAAMVETVWWRIGLLTSVSYIVVHSVTDPTFAGTHGFEILVLFTFIGSQPKLHSDRVDHALGPFPHAGSRRVP